MTILRFRFSRESGNPGATKADAVRAWILAFARKTERRRDKPNWKVPKERLNPVTTLVPTPRRPLGKLDVVSAAVSHSSPKDPRPRTLVVGDIHGCLTALIAAMEEARLTDEDEVILLGDLVDRGPDSDRVVQWAIERTAAAPTITLLGNHEAMMLNARDSEVERETWLGVGGSETLTAYWPSETIDPAAQRAAADTDNPAADAPEPVNFYIDANAKAALDCVPEAHWAFMKDALLFHETKTDLFIHGGLDSEAAMSEQVVSDLLWRRFDDATAHCSGKRAWCGHTPQRDYRPRAVGNTPYETGNSHTICLDTAAFAGGWLTVADVKTGAYWQGNQWGEARQGSLVL